jgi:protein-S-isoprenylcysteine O-methyltransferase Ste14
MNCDYQTKLIKRYRLEHLVPLGVSLISIYFWINYFQISLLSIFGLLINIFGLFVWWAAKIELGENWGAGYGKPRVKKLITTGIYSYFSHPLYLGVNLTLIGLFLLYPKIWFIIITGIIVIYFFSRMRIETVFLSKELGKKYIDYRKKTWF